MKIENNILKSIEEKDIVNGTVVIPSSVTEIAEDAFLDCELLKNIVIPDNVKVIGKQAFANCKNLKSIKLPSELNEIKDSTFKNCVSLSSIEIPEQVKTIGPFAFYDCSSLFKVKLGSNLESIENDAFNKCTFLSKIDLPNSLKSLGSSSFKECKNLKSIVIPPQIKMIPKEAFYFCHHLTKVTLPEGLTEIGDHSFFLCTELKHITLPNSLKEIDNGAFHACYRLREITIPENVVRIDKAAFEKCELLGRITLPENLKFLGAGCFRSCYTLQNIHLPESLEYIENGIFTSCFSLKKVNLPNNLTEVPRDMFWGCSGLREIHIPEGVTKINANAFNSCKGLKKINLPDNIELIDNNSFEDCKSLTEIILPSSLKGIGDSAFKGCKRLKEFNLPEGIEFLNQNFLKDCVKIKSLYIPSSIKTLKNPNDSYFEFIEKSNDGFVILNQPGNESYPIDSIKIQIPTFFRYKDINPNLINEQKNEFVADFYETFIPNLNEEQLDRFMKNHNFTFFKKIMKLKPKPGYFDRFNKMGFYTGLYNLGGLNGPAEYNGKKIDYSQKVVGKLLDYIEKEDANVYNRFTNGYDRLSHAFEKMNIDGFKKDFTDFYLDKIVELMKENYDNENFISRAYNEFEEVQATNTNNRGSQRQLKPTIEKFKSYFNAKKFTNLTKETQPIAEAIAPYFDKQDIFEKGVEIMNEFKDQNVPANILAKPLTQVTSPFKYIDEMEEKINEVQASTLGNLTQTATNEFTYEWLEKNDPTNLILGKLCSCCAHLQGAGFGIMHASIIHPNVQNLVVKNEEGRIIAKSTLFVNPDEQYGVLNNFEVYQGIPKEQHKETYKRFMQGISDFAKQYNIEHPDKPLKQINVGTSHNDLIVYVSQINKKTTNLLKAIHYGKYGYDTLNYDGDSFSGQYIVWENKDLIQAKDTQTIEESEKQS